MIGIFMATYNGATYVSEQLDSLLLQTEQGFTLHVCDDASTDGTMEILQDYAKKHPGKIHVVQNKLNSGSPCNNFLQMLAQCEDDYAMLCDQDDVWKPNKIELTMQAMQEAERTYGASTPLLVHTDLCIVDANLKTTHPSFRRATGLDFKKNTLKNLMVQNTVSGCTTMINKTMINQVECEPENCAMHDWWLALYASAFGRIISLENEQTILYRQHGANDIGAKSIYSISYILGRLMQTHKTKTLIEATYRQALAFLHAYGEKMSQAQSTFLEEYCSIPGKSKMKRIQALFALGTFKHGLLRILGQILYI